jgi:uncharacterized membrane-anchored protein YjiN (DUF445 family)
VRAGLAGQLDKLDIAPLLGQMIETAMADKRHLPLIDGFVRWAGLTSRTTRSWCARSSTSAPTRRAALDRARRDGWPSVLDGLYKLLAEVLVNPDHPLRGKIEEGLAKLARTCSTIPRCAPRWRT